jgi:hypothetical protein
MHRDFSPAGVTFIAQNGFHGSASLTEVIFAPHSPLDELDGFRECTALRRIKIDHP